MANWNNPTLTSTYTNFVAEVKDRDVDVAVWFEGITPTNPPVGIKRLNVSNGRFERWNGSAWADAVATFTFPALTVAGAATFNGNTTIGDAGTDTLTVNAAATFVAAAAFNGNVTLGDAAGDTVTVNATLSFATAPVLTPGTANGVMFLNGSKAVSAGSALTFNGTNLGLGVTPSAWRSVDRALQVRGTIVENVNSTSAVFGLNYYRDASGVDRYINTDRAAQIVLNSGANGSIAFNTAPSGTVGNAISFTQAMTLDASGNLLVGTTQAGSPGLGVSNSTNISFPESDANTSFATMFRQASSADLVLGSGVRYSNAANGFASSTASAWARTAINVGYGAIKFFTAAEATVAVGTDTTLTERARIDSSGNLIANASVTGHWQLPRGTTAQRTGSPESGMIRFNTSLNRYEGHNGTAWSSIGGGATGGGTDDVFHENGQTVTTNYTLTTNKNAMSAGPITIASGITVTVPSGSNWVVV